MNTKLHAVTDANGRPISFFMTAGQVSDYTSAAALLDSLPKAQWMLADRGYDRCPEAFFSAVALAATVIFWLRSMSHRVIAAASLGPR